MLKGVLLWSLWRTMPVDLNVGPAGQLKKPTFCKSYLAVHFF